MLGDLIPMVVCTGMFAMIFGIVYIKSRENMAMIEKGINPKQTKYRPRPFVNLKWGLLLLGCGLGLLTAFMIDSLMSGHSKNETPIEKKIVINGKPGDSTHIVIDTVKEKPGKHIVIKKNGKTTTIDENISGDLERLDRMDNDTTSDNDDDDDDNDSKSGGHNIHVNIASHAHQAGKDNAALYFALIAIGGGLGLFFSYKIEKREWLDKIEKMDKYDAEA